MDTADTANTADAANRATRARAPRWHVVYSLLALFVVIVVGLALVYVHLIVANYDESITTNQEWDDRLSRYADLSEGAASVNAPGNDVFASLDVAGERARLDDAVVAFQRAGDFLRADLEVLTSDQAALLGAGLDSAERAVEAMTVASLEVFASLEAGRLDDAAASMARMDREHRTLIATLSRLRSDVSEVQRMAFEDQRDEVASLQRFEYLIAGFLLLMILAATYYGGRLRREFEHHGVEVDAHVAQLEATEAELRQARDVLEDRVTARTGQLAEANGALRGEIDERRRTEADLRLSEERYALAAYSANDGLWDWDLRGDHFYYSPRWCSLLGYEQEELTNGPNAWLDRVHPDDRPELDALIQAHLGDVSVPLESEHRVLHRDGTYRWMLVRATAVLDEAGQPSRMVGSHADVTARKGAELQLLHEALHDTLTGLPNRALFIDGLDMALRRSHQPNGPRFAVLFIDLDRFKVVNDSLGHVIGDDLLVEVGRRLKSVVRPGDIVARFGGDEFTILVDNLVSDSDAVMIADRVLAALTEPIHLNGYDVRASASIGIALDSPGYVTPAEILRDSDTAMYQAKSDGRSLYRMFEASMHDSALATLVLETDLRIAVERQELSLLYQPIVRLDDGEIVGFEALARWHHPTRGLISPSTFIAIAEESGDIVPLGRWVLSEACRQVSVWQKELPVPEGPYIAVNVSPRELWQDDFFEHVEGILRETGLAAGHLHLEITESSVVRNREQMIAAMQRLATLGVGISIDDFGTGYSSFSYIKDLPVDTLKIDRTFVAGLGSGGKDAQLVRTILELGHHLQLTVVAEGIESTDQERALIDLHCRYGQGYYYFTPMAPTEIDDVLSRLGQRTKTTG